MKNILKKLISSLLIIAFACSTASVHAGAAAQTEAPRGFFSRHYRGAKEAVQRGYARGREKWEGLSRWGKAAAVGVTTGAAISLGLLARHLAADRPLKGRAKEAAEELGLTEEDIKAARARVKARRKAEGPPRVLSEDERRAWAAGQIAGFDVKEERASQFERLTRRQPVEEYRRPALGEYEEGIKDDELAEQISRSMHEKRFKQALRAVRHQDRRERYDVPRSTPSPRRPHRHKLRGTPLSPAKAKRYAIEKLGQAEMGVTDVDAQQLAILEERDRVNREFAMRGLYDSFMDLDNPDQIAVIQKMERKPFRKLNEALRDSRVILDHTVRRAISTRIKSGK